MKYAAVTAGLVWGMGDTEEAAKEEAVRYLKMCAEEDLDKPMTIHPITNEQAERIEEGYCVWPGLT